jgi:hypothetical protein
LATRGELPHARVPDRRDAEAFAVDRPTMYFGDSTDSVGLQLVDACNWITWRHLRNAGDYNLFNVIKPHTFAVKSEPDWGKLKDVLVVHDAP